MKLIDQLKSTPVRAVIWDLDGTLIDSAPLHWQAWQEVLSGYNIELSHAAFLSTFGLRNEELITMWLGTGLPAAQMKEIADEKEILFRRLMETSPLHLMPAAEELLAFFQQSGWKQAIATMTPRKNLEVVLRRLPIRVYFDALLTGEMVSKGKPAPDIFLAAAAQLGVPAGQSMVIEDSAMGLEAAKSAGMLAVGIGQHPDSYSFPNLRELLALFTP